MFATCASVGLDLIPADGAHPQRAVADQERQVDRWSEGVEPVEVGLDRAPVVGDVGPAVEAGVHVGQRLEVVRVRDRRVAQPVDADHLGGDALAHLRLVERIGEDHQPRVRVQVDEPGRDDEPRGVDPRVAATASSVSPKMMLSRPSRIADRGGEAVGAAAVDDRAVLDDQVERLAHAGGAQLWSSTALPSGSVT